MIDHSRHSHTSCSHHTLHHSEDLFRERRLVFGSPETTETVETAGDGDPNPPQNGRESAEQLLAQKLTEEDFKKNHEANKDFFKYPHQLRGKLSGGLPDWLNSQIDSLPEPKPTETEIWDVFYGEELKTLAKGLLTESGSKFAEKMTVEKVEIEGGKVTKIHAYPEGARVAVIYTPDTNPNTIARGLKSAHNEHFSELSPIGDADLGHIDLTGDMPAMELNVSLANIGKEGVGAVEAIHIDVDLTLIPATVTGSILGLKGVEREAGDEPEGLETELQKGFQEIVNAHLKDKKPADLTPDLLAAIKDQCNADFESIMTEAITNLGEEPPVEAEAEKEPVELTGTEMAKGKFEKGFQKAFDQFKEGDDGGRWIGKLEKGPFKIMDKDEAIAQVTVQVEEVSSGLFVFEYTKLTPDGTETAYKITKHKDKKTSRVEFTQGGNTTAVEGRVKLDDMSLTIERNESDFDSITTVDLHTDEMNVSISKGEQEVAKGSRKVGENPKALAVTIGGREGALHIDPRTGEISFKPKAGTETAASGTEGDKKDKERQFLSGETQETISGFVSTLQELAAMVLELLASLGIDLNDKEDPDPDKQLWLFVGINQLGFKNVGKLKETSIGDAHSYLVEKDPKPSSADESPFDQPKTIALLNEAGFDTTEPNGEHLFQFLVKVDKKIKEMEAGDGTGYFDEHKEDDVGTFLSDTEMIDHNGRWSSKYRKFDGETKEDKDAKEKKADEEAAAKVTKREAAKRDTKNADHMKVIVNAEDNKGRDDLVHELHAIGVLEDAHVSTYLDNEDRSSQDFLVLLRTMTEEDQREFFTSTDTLAKGWPDLMKNAKERLAAIEAGKTDAAALADTLISLPEGLELGGEKIQFAATAKDSLTAALSQTIVPNYDNMAFTGESADTFAPLFGLRADQFVKLIKYLHEPEEGKYDGDNTSFGAVYNIPAGSPYTLADLVKAHIPDAPVAAPST